MKANRASIALCWTSWIFGLIAAAYALILQGVVASMNSLSAVAGPPIRTAIFAYFISSGAAGSALIFLVALAVAGWTFSTPTVVLPASESEPVHS